MRAKQECEMTQKTRNTNEARQGITGQGVRQVLTISLAGAVIALLVVWLAFFF